MNEIFDAREYEEGWEMPGYYDSSWKEPKELNIPPGKPTICSLYDALNYEDPVVIKQYQEMIDKTKMEPRDIGFLVEEKIKPQRIHSEGTLTWNIDPDQYFDTLEDDSINISDSKILDISPKK